MVLSWQPGSEAQAGPWENCESGDAERVILACSVVIDDTSTNQQLLAAAHDNRGVAFARKGQLDGAIADLDEAIRLDPRSAVALSNRGNAYIAKGQFDRSILDYSEAIRLDPGYVPPYGARGTAYLRMHKYAEALADLNEAVHQEPQSSAVYNNRGDAHLDIGEPDLAIARCY